MKDYAVILASNAFGYDRLRTAAWSIRKKLGDDTKIFVLTDDYIDPLVNGCIVVNTAKYFMSLGMNTIDWSRRYPIMSLGRLLTPLMDEFNNIDTLVYFDTDILVMSEDAKTILNNLEVSDHEFMAARDTGALQQRNKELITYETGKETSDYLEKFWRDYNIAGRTYVNSGFLIINLKKIRENGLDVYRRKLELFWREELSGHYEYLDQDFINIYMDVDTSLPIELNNLLYPRSFAHWRTFDIMSEMPLVNHYLGGCEGFYETARGLGYTKHAAACKEIPDYPVDLSDKKQLIIYLCYKLNEDSIKRYRSLVNSVSDRKFDVLCIICSNYVDKSLIPDDVHFEQYTVDSLHDQVEFTCINNTHINTYDSVPQWIVLTTMQGHPEYDYCWCIKDNVSISMGFKTLFGIADKYGQDLLCSDLLHFQESMHCLWWGVSVFSRYPYAKSYSSCNDVVRVSRRLCDRLIQICHEDNQSGTIYYENMWPTVAVNEFSCAPIMLN